MTYLRKHLGRGGIGPIRYSDILGIYMIDGDGNIIQNGEVDETKFRKKPSKLESKTKSHGNN